MANFIRHDYPVILAALNRMIVAEVKTALMELPDKRISDDGCPLCRIVIGPSDNFSPRNVAVDEAWVDAKDGKLHIYGRDLTNEDAYDQNWKDNVEPGEWTEDDDLIDITDFAYLVDKIAQEMNRDDTVNIVNKSVVTCGFVAESVLSKAVSKTI